MRVYILTISTKGARGERVDESGPLIRKLCEEAGYESAGYEILPDDRCILADRMKTLCDEHAADLILTTGGTGFSEQDVTPEATLDIGERIVPGIPEAMRMNSMSITKRAMLSRSASVIRKQTLIVNLPGSPKAVEENLTFILPALEHGLEILAGTAGECARPKERS